jgi:hypothetical protein
LRTDDRLAKSRREARALTWSLHRRTSVAGACVRPLRTTRIPTGDEAGVGCLGLFDPSALLIAMTLNIVGLGGALLPALGFVSRLQLQIAQLLGVQRGPGPRIAFVFAQQMPDDHRELPGGRDSGDMLAAPGSHAQEEGAQRAGARAAAQAASTNMPRA